MITSYVGQHHMLVLSLELVYVTENQLYVQDLVVVMLWL